MRDLKSAMRLLMVTALLVSLAGCSGPKKSDVDAALAAGDYDAAARMLRPYALKKTRDTELQQQWDRVRARAAQDHISRVDALIKRGDLDTAELAIEQAVYFCPENGEYRQQLMQLHEIRRGLSEQIRLVSHAMQRQDWLSARTRLEPMLTYSATFPKLNQMWQEVAQENYRIDMREGLRHLKISDYDEAEEYTLDALSLINGDARAERQLRTIRDYTQAKELALDARDMIQQENYVKAVKTARQALALHPDSEYIQSVRDEALRLAIERILAQEQTAYEAGDLRQSYLLLREAQALKPEQRKLQEGIANRHGIVTKEIAAGYLVHGMAQEESGHYGAALLYYWMAHEIRPTFEGLDVRLKTAEKKASLRKTYRLLVLPTAEGQRVPPGGGTLMEQTLITQLRAQYPNLLTVYSLAEMNGDELRDTGLPPDGVLSGYTEEMWLTTPDPVRTTKTVRYVAGTVPALNPEVERSKAVWQAAQQELPTYQQNLATAEKNYQKALARQQRAQRAYDQAASRPYTDPQRLTYVNAANAELNQARIGTATAMMTKTLAQSTLQTAQTNVEKKLNYYLSRPPYVDVPQQRDYTYVISKFSTHGILRAEFQWKDFADQVVLGPWILESTCKYDDTVVAGYPLAGIKEAPKDTPADTELLQNLAESIAKKLIHEIDQTVQAHGALLLDRAMRENVAENDDAELHYLVLAWVARRSLTPSQQREIRERIQDLTGYDIKNQRLDPASMP